MLQGAQLGDAGGVGDEGTGGRAAAGTEGNPVLPGVAADVRHDEEVRAEAHRADDRHLGLEALQDVRGHRAPVAHREPREDFLAQPRLLRLALGHVRELRHLVDMVEDLVVGLDALGDQQGVVAGFRQFGEEGAHLGGALEVVAGAVEAEAARVVLVLADADAQQAVVGVGLVLGDVVRVVGGQKGEAQVPGQAQQVLPDLPLDVQAVVHQLQEVVFAAEDVLVGGGSGPRLGVLAQPQAGLDLAGGAAGGGDDALRPFGDQLAVHTRLPGGELALVTGLRTEPEQVAQALAVPRPHGQVGEAAAAGDVLRPLTVRVHRATAARPPELLLAYEPGRRRHVRLDADDRPDALEALGDLRELIGAEHVAVVAHGDRRHALPGHLAEHRPQLLRTVQHRVLGVIVQVDEGIRHGCIASGRGSQGVPAKPQVDRRHPSERRVPGSSNRMTTRDQRSVVHPVRPPA